jgi:hypothetical protein
MISGPGASKGPKHPTSNGADYGRDQKPDAKC